MISLWVFQNHRRKGVESVMKRLVDVLGGLAGLVLLSPVIFAIAILVRWKIGSPVFFRQTRPGQNGKPFKMLKFRTMTDAIDAEGNQLSDALRLTSFGRVLRSTSLDELPELWNVLKGDMSLVGPRPLLMDYLPLYSADQARRHEVRPGVTGWAQVNGRNAISWEEKFALDVWYVDNRSLLLDLRIILMTIGKALKREGVTSENSATAERFFGGGITPED